MSQLNQMTVKFNLYDKIKKAQREDPQMEKIREKTQKGEHKEFCIEDEVLRLGHRLCILEVKKIRRNNKRSSLYPVHSSFRNYKNVSGPTT